jgi:hypothetical protein
MSDRTKILANVLVKQEKWEALKIIVARDSQEVQAAFATFMANVERQSQKVLASFVLASNQLFSGGSTKFLISQKNCSAH